MTNSLEKKLTSFELQSVASDILVQPCLTEMPHWAKNYAPLFVRGTH